MKAKYITPQTIMVKICQNQSLLKSVSCGDTYGGETILSRQGGRVWDDDDDDEE